MKTDIIRFIKEQTEILEPKLSFTGPVTHCGLTDFIMSFIDEINKIMPYKYRLIIEEEEEENVDN